MDRGNVKTQPLVYLRQDELKEPPPLFLLLFGIKLGVGIISEPKRVLTIILQTFLALPLF